jgi:hypothetical protein
VDARPAGRDALVSVTIFLEGGGGSQDLRGRCREGFRTLLERCGYAGRRPKLVACGGRGAAFEDFRHALASARKGDLMFLWVDSEEPIVDVEATWEHLKARDGWDRPKGATNEQVLLMTTCMETLIVADRATLADHYGADLQQNALPSLHNLEERNRDDIQKALAHATRNCRNAYAKGKRSFEVLGKLDPAVLSQHLPSFARVRRILDATL